MIQAVAGSFIPPVSAFDRAYGSGFFSLSLADKVQRFTGVEVDKRRSKQQLETARGENGTFIEGTTEAHIQDLVDAYDPSQTAVILDPPRKGCHPSILNAHSSKTQTDHLCFLPSGNPFQGYQNLV